MKKIVLVMAAVSLFISCENEVKSDYVTFSGTITNMNSDSITISAKKFSKRIQVSEDGTFSDTLKVEPGFYTLFDGGEYARIYLKNGDQLHMTLDTEQFDETIAYTGQGSENSNFLADKARLEEKLFDIDIDDITKAELDAKMSEIETTVNEFIDSKNNLDTLVINSARRGIVANINGFKGYVGQRIAMKEALPKGSKSPTFQDYENHAGGTTSLEDMKGKYVYVDVWATWCGPCKVEIPSLKKIEADYHDQNIEFVSISVDVLKDHPKWVKMVDDKSLGGVQLYADNNWKSQFVEDYFINGIPRFILIDPEGNIVSPDAPRPSDPKLRAMLDKELL